MNFANSVPDSTFNVDSGLLIMAVIAAAIIVAWFFRPYFKNKAGKRQEGRPV
ncbi:MAG: hypothetical protein KGI49_00565 [Patescibacteria group bacterium]|nr:hypothetical protein [Patescibacteria group bacterium]